MNPLAQALCDIESTFGSNECLEYCNNLYNSTYRIGSTFTVNDEPTLMDDLVYICAVFLAKKTGKYIVVESITYSDSDYEEYVPYNENQELVDSFRKQAIEIVKSNAKFSFLCNYKGEDAGYDLFEAVQHLQVYVDKYNYI